MKDQISDIGHDTDEILEDTHVKDDPDVVKASKELSKRRDAIIDEVCRKDAEYSRLSDACRTAIETAYAKKNHQKPAQAITKN